MKLSSLKSYAIPFLAFLVIAGAVFGFFSSLMRNIEGGSFLGSKKSVNFVTAISELNFPDTYNKPLLLLNNTFSIQPLKAEAAQAVAEKDKKTVRYVNAYVNTDVVQTKYSHKIKEDIILKQPGHPEEFAYQVDMSNYDFRKDQEGNFVFYQKGKSDSELSRIFTIPAPFMIDTKGKKSSVADVDSNLTADGKLTIRPNQNWLKNSAYPVILDPTIEINIINVHSHPDRGDNWTVNFTTQGTANLKIIPVDQATIDDDEFVSLSCGNNKTSPQILAGDVIYFPNWSCSETATIIHYTKKSGKHTLRFEFGDQVAYAYNTSSEIIFRAPSPCNPAPVTGGTITYTDSSGANPRSSPPYSGGYTVHTFTSSGSMVITNNGNVSVLVVAGGGGGATATATGIGGGGGAGGVIYNSSFAVTAQTYTVTVGNGGGSNSSGGNSVFSSLTATGGGKGGNTSSAAGNGGSGGGAGTGALNVGGTGTAGQGNDGGSNSSSGAGGGGGAGAAGGNGVYQQSGAGGVGAAYSISGNSTYYGGGGGGAGNTAYSITAGAGGTGGGGAGGNGNGTSGTANTGGGGGGAGFAGYTPGSGGSGIVIVRYLTSDFTCATQNANIVFRSTGVVAPTGGTITYTDSSGANPRSSPAYSGGYTVHTFTTTGNSTFKVTKSGNVSVLVVAGGGGGSASGSYIGGGGGAGGVIYNSSFAVTAQSYTVTVGGGGAANNNGGNSVFSTITAIGGGKGAADSGTAGNGGSGGGASYNGTRGTASPTGQGNDGGTGAGNVIYGASGGGGGAGAAGGNGVNTGNTNSQSGAGGIGSAYSISGVSTYYGGGGGGGTYFGHAGAGGTGGGGAGGGNNGSNGQANTGGGGGGGGGGFTGGTGGSGIVIIRYLTSDFAADPDPVILK